MRGRVSLQIFLQIFAVIEIHYGRTLEVDIVISADVFFIGIASS